MKYKLNQILTKYSEKNTNNYEPVAVGRYGIRKRSDIYKKELSNDYLKNKVIFQNVLIIGMGSVQIDVGVLKENLYYSVSPAYHTFKINTSIVLSEYLELLFLAKNSYYTKLYMIPSARQGKKVDVEGLLNEIVEIPNLIKQQEIIDKINKINKLTRNYENQLQLLDEIIKSRFVEMFKDMKANAKFNDCVIRMTKGPFGSSVKKDLYVPESDEAYKVYIQLNCIQKNETLGDYYISKDYFDKKMRPFEIEGKDYLITCDGTLGKYIRLSENPRKGIISSSLLRIKLNENVIVPKYFEVMWDEILLDKLKKQVRNGCLIHLPSAKVIGNEYVNIPLMKDQLAFAAFVEQVDKLKFIVEEQLKLMNELLNKKMDEYFS